MIMKPIAVALTAALVMTSGPARAVSEKEADCQFQANLLSTVQKARLNGVSKDKLTDVIKASNPGLSESVLAAVPAIADHVYSINRKELKDVDLGAATKAQCLENWDQIQAMKKTVKN